MGSNPSGYANHQAAIQAAFFGGWRTRGYENTEVGSTTRESDTGVSRSASADERLCNSSVAKSNPSSIVTQWTPPFRRLFFGGWCTRGIRKHRSGFDYQRRFWPYSPCRASVAALILSCRATSRHLGYIFYNVATKSMSGLRPTIR